MSEGISGCGTNRIIGAYELNSNNATKEIVALNTCKTDEGKGYKQWVQVTEIVPEKSSEKLSVSDQRHQIVMTSKKEDITDVRVEDLNNDGKLDIIVQYNMQDCLGSMYKIYFNNGQGEFSEIMPPKNF